MCQAQVMLINKNVSLMKNGFVSFMKNGLKIEPDIFHPLGKKKVDCSQKVFFDHQL